MGGGEDSIGGGRNRSHDSKRSNGGLASMSDKQLGEAMGDCEECLKGWRNLEMHRRMIGGLRRMPKEWSLGEAEKVNGKYR